jgi:hypothetical protein
MHSRSQPRSVIKAPDWLYVPSVREQLAERNSYTPNLEGDVPTIVMEFLSETEGGEYSFFISQVLNFSIPPVKTLSQSKYHLQRPIDLAQNIRFQFPSNRHQPQPPIDRSSLQTIRD